MRILPFACLLGLTACTTANQAAVSPQSPSSSPTATTAPTAAEPIPVAAPAASPGSTTAAAPAAAPITLTYLGVAGWSITDGTRTVLVDPYFTRPSFAKGAPIATDPAALTAAFAARQLPARADAIVVGHSHVDHVLDAPAVAKQTGAQLLGTPSTANYALAAGLPPNQIVPVKGGEDYAFDGFSIRVIPGLHSALDDKHVFGSNQTIPHGLLPKTMEQFAEGGTLNYLIRLGGHQILVIGSANFIEREVEGLRPDIALIAPGLRQEIYDYSCRLMRALGNPPTVLTTHFDAWTKPALTPLSADAQKDLADFTAEIHSCSPATRVIIPKTFEPVQQ
jgi:L-ascorbate metabolism protein UlaG (beta-lactamase superfamily)